MNKFNLVLGVLTGFAGVMVFNRYMAAKKAAKELREYENLDTGLYADEDCNK